MPFSCPRCNFVCKQKDHIIRHIERQTPCEAINLDIDLVIYKDDIINGTFDIIKCIICNKLIKSGDNHIYDCAERLVKEHAQIKEQLAQIKSKYEELIHQNTINGNTINGNNNTNTINNITNNNNYNIVINGYDNTSLRNISDSEYARYAGKMYVSVLDFIEHVHFNPNKPENHNVYISNLQGPHAKKYNHRTKKVENVPKEAMIDKLIKERGGNLENWVEANKDNYPKAAEKFQEYQDNNTPEKQNILASNVELLMYNNRDMIKSTIKKYSNNTKPKSVSSLTDHDDLD